MPSRSIIAPLGATAAAVLSMLALPAAQAADPVKDVASVRDIVPSASLKRAGSSKVGPDAAEPQVIGSATYTLNNVNSFFEAGELGNVVVNLQLPANAVVTGLSWNLNLTAFDPSYLSELALSFSNSTNTAGVDCTPAFEAGNPGVGQLFSGSANLVELNLSFAVGSNGLLRLEFFETFDDGGVSPDGRWNSGTLTFQYDALPVPEVGTDALMALGLAGIGLSVRRRRPAA